jgi:hypothetical protein
VTLPSKRHDVVHSLVMTSSNKPLVLLFSRGFAHYSKVQSRQNEGAQGWPAGTLLQQAKMVLSAPLNAYLFYRLGIEIRRALP